MNCVIFSVFSNSKYNVKIWNNYLTYFDEKNITTSTAEFYLKTCANKVCVTIGTSQNNKQTYYFNLQNLKCQHISLLVKQGYDTQNLFQTFVLQDANYNLPIPYAMLRFIEK